MAKLFAIARMANGKPDIDLTATPIAGYVLCDQIGNQGAYLFSGTTAQLIDLNALPQVVGIVGVTETGATRWVELDNAIAAGVRTKLNTWLTARGYLNIPVGWTYRRVINAIYQRLNVKFDLSQFDVIGPADE